MSSDQYNTEMALNSYNPMAIVLKQMQSMKEEVTQLRSQQQFLLMGGNFAMNSNPSAQVNSNIQYNTLQQSMMEGNPSMSFNTSGQAYSNLRSWQHGNLPQDHDLFKRNKPKGSAMSSETSEGNCRVLFVGRIPVGLANPDGVYQVFSRFGEVQRVKILRNDNQNAMVQMKTPSMAERAFSEQHSLRRIGTAMYVHFVNGLDEITMPGDFVKDGGRTKDFTIGGPTYPYSNLQFSNMNHMMGTSALSSRPMNDSTLQNMGEINGSCLWVSGLPEELVIPDALCNIFGNYGNVRRIKISHKKPDCALVQMFNPSMAARCRDYLHRIKVNGKTMNVAVSGMQEVIIGIEQDEKSKDYSEAGVHRFSHSGTSTKLNLRLSAPTSVLLVSNIPNGKLEELKLYVVESGYTVRQIEELENERLPVGNKGDKVDKPKLTIMALIELASIEEAIMAMAKLHNTILNTDGEKKHSRLQFTFTKMRLFVV